MDRPWEHVTDPDYFRGAMLNMAQAGLGRKEDVRLRFGTQGDGKYPNYQLHGNDRVIRFNGLGHGRYHEEPFISFEETHLSSRTFGYDDIKALLAKALGK